MSRSRMSRPSGGARNASHRRDAPLSRSWCSRDFASCAEAPAARRRLQELQEAIDAAQAERDQLGSRADVEKIINAVDDWDSLTYDERRALIKATVRSVEVFPATHAGMPAPERVTVSLYGVT